MEVGLSLRPTANGMEYTITAIAQSQPECRCLLRSDHLPGQLRQAGVYPALRWRQVLPSSEITAALLARLNGRELGYDTVITTLRQLSLEAELHDFTVSYCPEAIALVAPGDPDAAPGCFAGTHPLAQSAA